MVRVLHVDGPDDARRRAAFLGVPPDEADRLAEGLRPFLLAFPLAAGDASSLEAALDRRGILHARGSTLILFCVSSLRQVEGWMREDGASREALAPAALAIERHGRKAYAVPCRDRVLDLSGAPRIMGILNVTPDSFSDGGLHATEEDAVRRGLAMAAEGAAVIDVGGESTRPGSEPVPAEVELDRVLPVIRALAARTETLISVDTTKAVVAREAAAAGARIVNDTSALADDPGMASAVRETGCAAILMHRRGTPATMQRSPAYDSLFDELLAELEGRIGAAKAAGIPEERLLVDPGIGFGKRLGDNLALHRRLADLRCLGRPIVLGPSRKSFLGSITGRGPGERAFGTAAAVTAAVLGGARLLRVHDVREMADAVKVAAAVAGADEC